MTDDSRIKELRRIREENNRMAYALSDYINEYPCAITASLMKEADPDGDLPEERLYKALMSGICGINENDIEANGYIAEGVCKLSPEKYAGDPYYSEIKFPDVSGGGWKFTHSYYRPFEAFVRDDVLLKDDFREIQRIGYFSERFVFPSVLQNGREWMAIKPSEVETMRPVIEKVRGKVAAFGLGAGYFAYMAALKDETESVTVIERDPEAIALFNRYILPQFEHREKIKTVRYDAFEYMEKVMPDMAYDYAFVDLWHDNSDGPELFLRAKPLEKLSPDTEFFYWAQEYLFSAIRWNRFDQIIKKAETYEEVLYDLGDDSLSDACMQSTGRV
ncbi:MAG: hypothetical protein LKI59_06320 [Bacteroidales bacterium]|jgi:hypothetical protein|nr:hypothetical protein [Bacteroidales bacterium]